MSEPAFDVFLCHHSPDKPAVEKIAEQLRDRGLRPWLDVWELQPGLPWQPALEAQIETIRAAAVFVGPSGQGPWQNQELQAFLGELTERRCPVIPVILPSCEDVPKLPIFLRNMTYVDFRVEHPDPLERLIWGITSQKPAPVDPGPTTSAISISHLPVTGEQFVGRTDELARLDAAWAEPSTHVISFVAFGGVGKSALVNRWLDALAQNGWDGAERVLGWSFYSQGTDTTAASGDAFVEFALKWFGYEGDEITSPWEKGAVLARHVQATRTLLVLDGLEPLQHPPGPQGPQAGRIKDPAVQALVRELAAQNAGLCVITTRLPVADVAGRAGTVAVDLDQLPPAAGAELLRRLEVEGADAEMRKASEEFGGHGLALNLLGTYLRDVCDADVRRRHEVPLLDEEIEQGGHARRVLESYEAWLGAGPERQVLSLVGLFDRPAPAEALAALREEPAIPGLTEGLGTGEEARWRQAMARLRKARLVAGEDADGSVDAHPLVRAYFGDRVREQPEAWRAGHERLYEYYKQATDERPETLEAMLPLYAAVVHGCRAGRVQEAFQGVYRPRIHRGGEFFSQRKLGAFSADLTIVVEFFDRPWDQPSVQLTAADQAWILNEAGFVLRALGRLPEAVQPMRAGLRNYVSQEQWEFAARVAGNLSELTLTLGEVASAVQAGEESVELADKSEDAEERMGNRTTLADALHQAGRREESAAAFREAEAMQAERQPQYPRLYSLRGYRYCDLLLGPVRGPGAEPEEGRLRVPGHSLPYKEACEQVRERAKQFFEWRVPGDSVLDIALDHLTLGRAHLGLALTSEASPDFTEAAEYLDRAVDGLRQAGRDDCVPWGLLARAALHRLRTPTGTLADAAASDLLEAQEIAERGHMRLHEADVYLEWTRLHLHAGDGEAARPHLERARELVRTTGYGRREPEVASLERRLDPGWQG